MENKIVALSQANLQDEYQIFGFAPEMTALLEKLAGFGMIPGASLQVLQRKPSLVIKVLETELALDREMGSQVFLQTRRMEKSGSEQREG